MAENQGGQGATKGGKDKPANYVFFVNKDRFETDQSALKAGQIKARVSGVEAGDKLSLEGQGNDPDRILQDDDLIELDTGRGPLRFTVVPSASFGG